MKLKEKLADEYVRSTGMIIHSPVLADSMEAKEYFIAGFEKAREMAVETARNRSYRMNKIGTDINSLLADLKSLGEEEVKK